MPWSQLQPLSLCSDDLNWIIFLMNKCFEFRRWSDSFKPGCWCDIFKADYSSDSFKASYRIDSFAADLETFYGAVSGTETGSSFSSVLRCNVQQLFKKSTSQLFRSVFHSWLTLWIWKNLTPFLTKNYSLTKLILRIGEELFFTMSHCIIGFLSVWCSC